jgi:hypothetical protein
MWRVAFFIFNSFLFNISVINAPKFFLHIWPFWSLQCHWHDQITLSCHMHWRGNICHVRRRFQREKWCHTIPTCVTVLFCRATGSGVTWPKL